MPTPEQMGRFDELAKVIAAAESEAQLRAAWEQLAAAYKADEVTTVQAQALRSALQDRKAGMDGPPPITSRTRGRLFALFTEFGWDGDENKKYRRDWATSLLHRNVESMSTLTEDEGRALIGELERKREKGGAP
jgi:hypothetical protein